VQPAPDCLDRLRAQLEAVRPPIRAEQRRPVVVVAGSNGCDHPGPRLREVDHAPLMFRRHGSDSRYAIGVEEEPIQVIIYEPM
jgi:hypothetical protein